MRRVVAGRPLAENVGAAAIDWGRGLVAYGCQRSVVIADPRTLAAVQTLDEHHAPVTAVRWAPQPFCCHATAQAKTADLPLASGDSAGHVVVWAAAHGSVLCALRDVAQRVDALCWHPELPGALLSLHRGGRLALWDAAKGALLWSVAAPDVAAGGGGVALAFSPFEPAVVAFASRAGAVAFIYDFSIATPPGMLETKYRIGSASSSSPQQQQQQAPPSAFRAFAFSPHLWNVAYFLLARELVVFDMNLGRAIGSTPLDRSCEPFLAMLLCSEDPSRIFCLHEDGSLSSWKRSPTQERFVFELDGLTGVSQLQQRKGSHKKSSPSAAALCPVDQNRIVTVSLDGGVWLWEYSDAKDPDPAEPLSETPMSSSPFVFPPSSSSSSSSSSSRRAARSGKLGIVGELETLHPAKCMAVCPADSLAATATEDGVVQVVDLSTATIRRSFQIVAGPINLLAWIDRTRLLVCCTTSIDATKATPTRFSSSISVVEVVSGTVKELRAGRPAVAPVRSMRVSPCQQFLAVHIANLVEFWDIASATMFKSVRAETIVTAIEWLPSKSTFSRGTEQNGSALDFSEQLILALESGMPPSLIPSPLLSSSSSSSFGNIRVCTVNRRGVAVATLDTDLGSNINAIACKGPFVATGDSTGTVVCWNSGTASSRSFQSAHNKVPIVSLEFCSGTAAASSSSSYLLLALYHSGECVIWDLQHGTRAGGSSYLSQRGLTTHSASWLEDNPVLLNSDGCIRVLDRALAQSTSPIRTDRIEKPVLSPLVLGSPQALLIRSLLLNFKDMVPESPHLATLGEFADPTVIERISGKKDTLDICLEVAKYFDSAQEVRFWTLAKQAIKSAQEEEEESAEREEEKAEEEKEKAEDEEKPPASRANTAPSPQSAGVVAAASPMAQFLSNLSNAPNVKEAEARLAVAHKSCFEGVGEIPQELQRQLSGYDILVGRRDEAVDLLMMSTGETKFNYTTALKACVVAASISTEAFRNTAKMVAAQLIAQGQLQEGVQLLCCIGKAGDACKYLLSECRWTQAAWLACVSLQPSERVRILEAWASHLVAAGLLDRGIEVLLEIGDFHHVLCLLHKNKCWETAAMFVRCCHEHGLLQQKSTPPPSRHPAALKLRPCRSPSVTDSLLPLASLIPLIFNEHAKYLKEVLGLDEFAARFQQM